ncbi:MAG: acyl-CoA dehydrogenase family protein, partial [Gemmatimonadota bacterium]
MRPPLTQLSEEEVMFRDAVAAFANNEVRPRVKLMETAGKLDKALVEGAFGLGLMGIAVPESLGGSGGSLFMVALAVEEISKVDASSAILVDVQNTLVNYPINRSGSNELKAKYLPRLTSKTVGAYALSEPGSGSDAFGLTTHAQQKGDAWVLNGRKMWITNGAEAEIFVVFANANPDAGYKGITAFIVERGFPGFAVGKKEDKLGIRASSTTELMLDNVTVPAANVLGQVGQGYKIAIETLNEGRVGIGAQMIGVAQGALAATVEYVKER